MPTGGASAISSAKVKIDEESVDKPKMADIETIENLEESIDFASLPYETQNLILLRWAQDKIVPGYSECAYDDFGSLVRSVRAREGLFSSSASLPELAIRKAVRMSLIVPTLGPVEASIAVRFDTPTRVYDRASNTIRYIAAFEECLIDGFIFFPARIRSRPNRLNRLLKNGETRGDVLLGSGLGGFQQTLARPDGAIMKAGSLVMFDKSHPEHIISFLEPVMQYYESYWRYVTQYIRPIALHASIASKKIALAARNSSPTPSWGLPDDPVTSSHSAMLSLISNAYGRKINPATPWADLVAIRFLSLFFREPDDDLVEAALANAGLAQQAGKLIEKLNAKRLASRREWLIISSIIERRLGAMNLSAIRMLIEAAPARASTLDKILSLLEPAQRKTVHQEYKHQIEQTEIALKPIQCAHLKIVRDLRMAKTTNDIKAALNACKALRLPTPALAKGASKDDLAMVACKLCKHSLICPHVLEFIESSAITNERYEATRARMIPYIERSQTSSSASPSREDFCKICGEKISGGQDVLSAPLTSPADMDEDLKQDIRSEVSALMKYLAFGELVNVPRLISSVRDIVYPFMSDILRQIAKSRTATAEENKAKLSLYICIYAFATLAHVVLSNAAGKGAGGPASARVSFKVAQSGTAADALRFIITTIMSVKNSSMRIIPGMSVDMVKSKLIDAYKAISTRVGITIRTHSDVSDNLIAMSLNPIFSYYQWIHGDAKEVRNSNDIAGMLHYIFGEELSILKARKPNFSRWPPVLKNDSAQEWRRYISRAAELFHDYVTTPELFGAIEGAILKKHNEARQELLSLERDATRTRRVRAMPPISRIKFDTRRASIWPDAGYGRIYDEDGKAHDWSIFVDEKGKDHKADEWASAVEKGAPLGVHIADRRCKDCGILQSKSESLRDADIIAAVSAEASIAGFFIFYESRCPKGDMHVHEKLGDPCKFCGASLPMKPGKEAMNYYREHRARYEADRASLHQQQAFGAVAPVTPVVATSLEAPPFDYNLVVELATLMKSNPRAIMAIGASEGQKYDDIISGSYIPREVESNDHARIAFVMSYIITIIREYNILRNYTNVTKAGASSLVANVVAQAPLSPADARAMPQIDNAMEFMAQIDALKNMKANTANSILNYCIQKLVRKILFIHNASGTALASRRAFASAIFARIMTSEEMMTKPGYFNLNVLWSGDSTNASTQEESSADREGSNAAGTAQSDDEDDGPLSTSAFDIEDSDDEDQNLVRVEGID